MSDSDYNRRDDIFSNPIRAGKRTYFFDVKATRGDDYYITITESKRRMSDNGKFIYDKHKIHLYKEDFEKFTEGFESCLNFIKEQKGEEYIKEAQEDYRHSNPTPSDAHSEASEKEGDKPEVNKDEPAESFSDIDFDDLGKNSEE